MRRTGWSWRELAETPEDVLLWLDAIDAKAAHIAKARGGKG